MRQPSRGETVADKAYRELTPREQETMRMLVEGYSVKEIADSLHLSPKTVDSYRSGIMRKLAMGNFMELVRYAVRIGLVDVDQWKA